MQSEKTTKFYSLRADANALGGYLEEPFRNSIAPLAPVSLPAVGGFATARSAVFTLEHIVRCSSAYTRVSGQEYDNETISIRILSVVEDLNLLNVVTAKRVVAELSIVVPADRGPLQVSTAGSTFEGLCVKGQPTEPQWNKRLQPGRDDARFTMAAAKEEGRQQADRVLESLKGSGQNDRNWAENRFAWMRGGQACSGYLCSLLDGFGPDREGCHGHVVDIPGYGKFIFGELLISADSVQVVSIRAELGCPVKGKISINAGGGGGIGNF